ncbi:GNAT family N-acetyltransferase [Alteromonas sp. ASW11-19]|uniref:GNAT family N-acetyltransferase n=1 Tax=Alteromonas salexigens TaxID=2982530 RepID=A0ABT2VL50_9ALTE|nr:GNAT family N-acetyltransferase [Alteromonas salexigens]MCU7553553.1 GNAT family N-acetyltransferase [Alteromonas salexigens]
MQFRRFTPSLAGEFDRINREWITEMFELEPIDEAVISDPQTHIIDCGGYIWFACNDNDEVVGTCALHRKKNGVFELTKMGVSRQARGQKVGEALLMHVLAKAQVIAFDTLFLLTNARCETAIHLYEKAGFVHDDAIMQQYGGAYDRCDVAMRYRPQTSRTA